MTSRRFPPPWDIEEHNRSCFIVRDNNGQALAYVYFETEPGRRTAAKLLTRDVARRIASNIAKLPVLLPQRGYRDKDIAEIAREVAIANGMGKLMREKADGKARRWRKRCNAGLVLRVARLHLAHENRGRHRIPRDLFRLCPDALAPRTSSQSWQFH